MSLRPRLLVLLLLPGLLPAPAPAADSRGAAAALPPVRHVFLLLLENQAYAKSFAARSPAPYLAQTLTQQGALLTQYYAIGHASLPNYVALVSGQAPNEATQLDCPRYVDFRPDAPHADANGQLPGTGCVYPASVRTLPDELEAAGLTWRGYMEDMGRDPARDRPACAHVGVGQHETTHMARRSDQYAARHNPFVYFHSIIDDAARCDAHVVNLDRLQADLAAVASTPNFVFITPNLCNDGHDEPCVDGRPGGLKSIDEFLRKWVPLIMAAPAFRADGMLVVTFDESDGEGPDGSSACCGEQALPGAKYPPGLNGPGGGRIGAVVLSPFVRPGTVSSVPYNHYALLRTIATLFGVPPSGYAAAPAARPFGPDVFSAAAPRPPAR